MSKDEDSNNLNFSEIFQSQGSEEVFKSSHQIAALQTELEKEKDARREERFIWVVCVLILFDVVFFSAMDNALGAIVILILELLILIPIARRLGMNEISQLLDRILNSVTKRNPS